MKKVAVDFAEIGRRHGVTAGQADEVWQSMFLFITEKASSFDFMELDGEELDNTVTDFTLPGLGHLRLNRKRMKHIIKCYKETNALWRAKQKTQQHERDKSEEDQAGVHDGASDLRQV